MDDMENLVLLQSLNPQQKEAVTSLSPYVRVLAGAGSGKTRILTHRIAWLIQQQGVPPYSILAVTFTNKAAYEMRGRIEAMLGIPIRTMWVGTFHGLAHRLLRAHWKEVDLPQSFQILDSDDQYRLIRRVQRSLNLEETQWPPKQTQWFINKQKERGWRPHQVANSDDSYFTEVLVKVYKAYEEVCRRSGLVDFSELLLRSLELLRDVPSIRHHYQQRFHHILVDEFQDTNTIQYDWLRALMGDNTGMMAVGDDDQSIYSWRGAKIENIHRFSRDFTDVQTIRLEQNYRSTKTILDAANAVIENNTNRLGKKLWTTSNTGERISLYTAFNERDEAFYIISCIESWIQQERKYSDIAILYRSNAQSRLLEERLIDRQIPYRIYGGLKFFERTEIKDALAYLRLLANRYDDAAFERVVNTPTRGIGNTTLITLRAAARDQGISLWQAAMDLINNQGLSARALNSLQQFLNLIETLSAQTKNLSLAEQTEKILNQSGLLALYKKDKNEKGLSRVENLEELISATSQFTPEPMTDETILLSPLDGFLSHVALETGEEQASSHSDCVNLMTLHSAKGLEFRLVIIGGLEENLFPHHMSTDSENGLEEERRLCYVGMTRAKEKLILTYAECRHLHGLEKFNQPSRFLNEIPPELIDIVRPTPKISRPVSITYQRPQAGESEFYVGQRVNHTKFGRGIIINYEDQGENTRLQVKFDSHGEKWLVSSYAKLEALS
ncbi:DNA helicase II [Candidatus Coxiella mudrowiae]|uniref:DNA helicase II n=1 Tax=Candidatus Coxiella mudrowiae TaxID=2054173 RepID=UPI000C28E414|nr:DNA helicase II [Candidatus Coxiella mudrowiae]